MEQPILIIVHNYVSNIPQCFIQPTLNITHNFHSMALFFTHHDFFANILSIRFLLVSFSRIINFLGHFISYGQVIGIFCILFEVPGGMRYIHLVSNSMRCSDYSMTRRYYLIINGIFLSEIFIIPFQDCTFYLSKFIYFYDVFLKKENILVCIAKNENSLGKLKPYDLLIQQFLLQ